MQSYISFRCVHSGYIIYEMISPDKSSSLFTKHVLNMMMHLWTAKSSKVYFDIK